MWSGPRFVVNGELQSRWGFGGISIADDHGRERRVRFKGGYPFDPTPPVQIDGELFHVAEPLHLLEVIWCMLPIGLLSIGGAVGGALGILSIYANFHVLRLKRPRVIRYLLSLGVLAGAVTVWLVVAILIRLALLT